MLKSLVPAVLAGSFLVLASCEPRPVAPAERPAPVPSSPAPSATSTPTVQAPKLSEPAARPAPTPPPASVQAPTQPVAVAPPADPYEAIADVQKRSFARRFDGLLEPVLKKGGPTDQAAEWLKEADSRARAVMQLSKYKLEFKDANGEKQLIALVETVRAFRPSGSVRRWGSQDGALNLARKMLEEDQQKGVPINRNARLALSKT